MKTYLLMAYMAIMPLCYVLGADKPDPNWNTGKLILNNGTEIEGDLSYNWKAEIVQLRQKGTIKAFSAHQISHFTYFDNRNNMLRVFSAVDYPVKRNLVRPIFLEEMTTGSMTVYRRLRHSREPIKIANPGMYSSDEVIMSDYDNFTYYVYANDKFMNLDNFNLDLWPQMQQEFGRELTDYIHARQLDLINTESRLMLISQYNSLKSQATLGRTQTNRPINVVAEDE